jgi:hypothetical protein
LHAVLGFADHVNVGVRAEQLLEPFPRRLLIVDH